MNFTFTLIPVPVVTPCDPNPCKNGAHCRVETGRTFTCICLNGFAGDTCEREGDFLLFYVDPAQ